MKKKDSTNIAKRTYNKRYIDGFSLGGKLKSAWNNLQPEDKAATISLLGGAVVSGVVILANYLIDRRTIKDIQLGVITEKDLVSKVADKILRELENSYMNYKTAMTIVPIIKEIKKAKTFDELRKYFSSSELDKAERLYRRAMATKKKESSIITKHDSMPWVKMNKTDMVINRHYRDDSKELIGTIGALIVVGLGMAIKKAVTSIVKRKAASNKENEILRAIRSGEINEQYFTREMKAQIVMSIDRLFNQGALDAFFESNHIDPTKQKAYVNKIKNGIKKCQTLQQIIVFLNSDSSFVLPTYFDGLETMNRLFQKAKTMKDSKIKDDNTDAALKIIDKTQSIVRKLNYPVVASYLAKIKNAVIGGNESALNNTVGNVIDFFATKEFEAKHIDKDIKKANLLKIARETINELYGLPIKDSKPCNILTHDSMPWVKKSRNDCLKRYNDVDLKSVVNKIKQQIAKVKQGLVDYGKAHPKAAFRIKRILKILAAIGTYNIMVGFANNNGKTKADLDKLISMKNNLKEGIIDLEKMDDGSYGMDKMPSALNIGLRALVGLLGKAISLGLIISSAIQKKTDSIRRHTDFDLKSKVSQLKAYFVKVKKDLEEWGERNPATKLAIKNMARAVSVAISIAAGRSFTKDLKTLEHLRDNVKNDYNELIQQRDGSFGLPAIPSKIKMGLKLFISALSGIITILISKSYTREERTANAINSFFNL